MECTHCRDDRKVLETSIACTIAAKVYDDWNFWIWYVRTSTLSFCEVATTIFPSCRYARSTDVSSISEGDLMKAFKIQSLVLTIVLLTASPGIAASKKNIFQDIWERIIRSQEQEKPRSVRGGICVVTPLPDAMVRNDRPIMAWQGQVRKVNLYRGDDFKMPIWSRWVRGNKSSVAYDGQPLAPGVYTWEAIGGLSPQRSAFKVMGGSDRDRLSGQFQVLLRDFSMQGIPQKDQPVLRLDTLLRENLLSDVVMEMYEMEGTSEDIEIMRKDFVRLTCEPKK